MGDIFLIWAILNFIALWLASKRVDKDAFHDALINFVITDNIITTLFNGVVAYAILPLTIPRNIINLLK